MYLTAGISDKQPSSLFIQDTHTSNRMPWRFHDTKGTSAQIEALCAAFGLPTAIPCDADTYAAAVGRDKKGAGTDISVILLEELGHAVAHKLPKAQLVRLLSSFDKLP